MFIDELRNITKESIEKTKESEEINRYVKMTEDEALEEAKKGKNISRLHCGVNDEYFEIVSQIFKVRGFEIASEAWYGNKYCGIDRYIKW